MAQVDYLAMNGLHLGGGVGSTKVRDGGRARTHPSRGSVCFACSACLVARAMCALCSSLAPAIASARRRRLSRLEVKHTLRWVFFGAQTRASQL